MGVGGQRQALAALPPRKTRCLLYRRLGGPQGRSRRVRKVMPPPGFDPRTVQPAASRYTDCAIPAHKYCITSVTSSSIIQIRIVIYLCNFLVSHDVIGFKSNVNSAFRAKNFPPQDIY